MLRGRLDFLSAERRPESEFLTEALWFLRHNVLAELRSELLRRGESVGFLQNNNDTLLADAAIVPLTNCKNKKETTGLSVVSFPDRTVDERNVDFGNSVFAWFVRKGWMHVDPLFFPKQNNHA